MGSQKKSGTTFCGKPVCVDDVQCPKGAITEAQKGLRERNRFLPFNGRLASLLKAYKHTNTCHV